MTKVLTPPTKWEEIETFQNITMFLAGSIEMNKATQWQNKLIEEIGEVKELLILNPRRADWDSSWVQDISNPQFNEQVNWELDAIEMSEVIVFYFDPETMSPITLMELGIVSQLRGKFEEEIIVCCPKGFWRKGNVDILCSRMAEYTYNLVQVESFDELVVATKKLLKDRAQRLLFEH